MANDINVVVLVGRLTRESELRYTTGGTAVCRFSIAVNRRKRSGDNWEDEVSYFDIVVWGKQAESLNPYLEKGRQISVTGELRQSRWEQDGQSRSKIEVVANNVQLLGGGQNREERASEPRASAQPLTSGPMDFPGPEQFDDDIPF